MASNRPGIAVETALTVTDAAVRSYGFSFACPDYARVLVAYRPPGERDEQLLPDTQVRIDRNIGRTGGQAVLLGTAVAGDPFTPAVGGRIRIFRDTHADTVTTSGGGFATAQAVAALDERTNRVLEELIALGAIHETTLQEVSVTPEDITRQVSAWALAGAAQPEVDGAVLQRTPGGVIDWSQIGGENIAPGGVGTAALANDAVSAVKLAQGVQARLLPGGGAASHILAKLSAAPYDVGWVPAPEGGTSEPAQPATPAGLGAELTTANLAADVDVATTAVNTWTDWATLHTYPAVTEAGVCSIRVDLVGMVGAPVASGGGDRVFVETRIVRRRTAADGTLADTVFYVRNEQNVTVASGLLASEFGIYDDAEVGDVYRVDYQVASQIAPRTLRFTTATKFQLVHFAMPSSGGEGGGGSVSAADILAVVGTSAFAVELGELEDALRLPVEIADAVMLSQGLSNALAPLPSGAVVSPDTGDREFEIYASTSSTAPADGAWHRVDYASLLALARAANSAQASGSNSIPFTTDGETYHVARRSGAGQWMVAAENIGDFYVWIRDFPLNVTRFVDTATDSQDGLVTAAEHVLIHAAADGTRLSEAAALTASELEDGDAVLLADASVAAGSPQLRRAVLSELDKRWATLTAGLVPPRLLGTGSADADKVLRGDGVWHNLLVEGNAVTVDASGFSAADDGSFPVWDQAEGGWIAGNLDSTPNFRWTFDNTSNSWKLTATDKLGEIVGLFRGGGWTDQTQDGSPTVQPDDAIWISNLQRTDPGNAVGNVSGFTYRLLGDNATGFQQGDAQNPAYFVARVRKAFEERLNLAHRRIAVYNDGTPNENSYSRDFDLAGVVRITSAGSNYVYFKFPIPGIAGDGNAKVQEFEEFSFDVRRLDLKSTSLSDMPDTAAVESPANQGKSPTLQADGSYGLEFPDPPPRTDLPEVLNPGQRYALSAPVTFRRWYDVTPAAGGNNDPVRADNLTGIDGSPAQGARWDLIQYAQSQGVATSLRGQWVLLRPTGFARTPLGLRVDGETYNLAPAAGQANHYVVQGTPSGGLVSIGVASRVTILFGTSSTAGDLPTAVTYDPGDYTASDQQTLIGTPGRQESWATVGNRDLIPPAKLPHVAGRDFLHHSFSLSPTSAAASTRWSAPYIFDPAVNLDDAENRSGEHTFTARVRVRSSESNTNFVVNKANPTDSDKTRILTKEVHLSNLRAQPDYVASVSGAPTGAVEFLELVAYTGGTITSTLHIAEVHNADPKPAGIFAWVEGGAGAQTITWDVEIWGHRTVRDPGYFTQLADTPNDYTAGAGTVPIVNAGATGLLLRRPSEVGPYWAVTPNLPAGNAAQAWPTHSTTPNTVTVMNFASTPDTPAGMAISAGAFATDRDTIDLPGLAPEGVTGLQWECQWKRATDTQWTVVDVVRFNYGGPVSADLSSGAYAEGLLLVDRWQGKLTNRISALYPAFLKYDAFTPAESGPRMKMWASSKGNSRPRLRGPSGGPEVNPSSVQVQNYVTYNWRVVIRPFGLFFL